jgi:hypothetical protein
VLHLNWKYSCTGSNKRPFTLQTSNSWPSKLGKTKFENKKFHDPSYKLTTLQQIEKLFTIVSVYQAGPSIKNSKIFDESI